MQLQVELVGQALGDYKGKKPGCVYGFFLMVGAVWVTTNVYSEVATLYAGLSYNTTCPIIMSALGQGACV